jgi:hypothetical protein
MTIPQDFQMGEHEDGQPRVIKCGYTTMLNGREKCQF